MSEEKVYSIILDENQIPQIIEGIVENATFIGTEEECQSYVLMSLLAD